VSKIRILLADDHAILRSGLIRLLGEESDIEVVGEAENGREAVQKVQELHPDIVLMDIGMPVMNGMEATKQIIKRSQEVKVLVLTMHDNEEYLFQVLQAGAAGYVLKKAADSDLVNAIRVVARGDCFLYPSAAKMVIEDYLEKLKSGQEPATTFDTLTEREREILRGPVHKRQDGGDTQGEHHGEAQPAQARRAGALRHAQGNFAGGLR
jgi:two-component system response regulator NreC